MLECTIQRAGYDQDQFDRAGQMDFSGFTAVFDAFPWMAELEKYHQLQKGCSATISVTNTADDRSLWVSVAGDTRHSHYLIGYVHLRPRTGLLGLGKTQEKKWLDIYSIARPEEIKRYFSLFFNGDYPKLEEELHLEKVFQSMPSAK